MDLILIIAAILIFAWEYFNEDVPTPEQRYWEQNLKESQKSIEEMKRKTYEHFHRDEK